LRCIKKLVDWITLQPDYMLSLPTLLLVQICFTLLVTVLLTSVALTGDALREQRLWAVGNVVASLGLIIGFADSLPLWVHGALSYGLVASGLALIWRGVCAFCGHTLSNRAVLLITLAATLLPGYFALIEPSLRMRLLVTGVFFGVLNLACAWTLWTRLHDEARTVMWASLLGFAGLGAALIVRGIYMAIPPEAVEDIPQTNMVQSVTMLLIPIAQVSIGFGLIVMVAHRYAHKLNRLSMLDSLTGAFNRVGMERLAPRTLNRARQSGRNVCVAMVDADHFKAINDQYGHPAGDVVLQHLVSTLVVQLRPSDLVIRYGGEEFLLVLDGLNLPEANQVAERLRQTVAASRVEVASASLRYHISIGISCSDSSDFDLKKLIEAADSALYRAKQQGRNRVCVA
jgi:diguanylate cyclase (GGDEF)-like protein